MGTLAWEIWIFIPMAKILKDWRGYSRTSCTHSCIGTLLPSLKKGIAVYFTCSLNLNIFLDASNISNFAISISQIFFVFVERNKGK